jgi:hypothetical protein
VTRETKQRNFLPVCRLEFTKLLRSPAILGFFAVCIIANVAVVFASSHKTEIDYLNSVAEVTGSVYSEEYAERLRTIPRPDDSHYQEAWLYDTVISASENARNVFAEWDAGEFAKEIEANSRLSSAAKQALLWKYARLAPVIEAKAARGDALDVYFSGQSYTIHDTVFGIIGKLLAGEACVFFALIMLWALGYENITGAALVVFSTKTGRRLAVHKIMAALFLGTLFFLAIYTVTYGLAFLLNDFSMVWGQNVSAGYHTTHDYFLGAMPFTTWSEMTVGGYFFAGCGVAFLNALAAALFAVPFGLMIRNVYAAFCAIAGLAFINGAAYIIGVQFTEATPFIWHLNLITPLLQAFHNTHWFSGGGGYMLLPRFETWYPLIFLALLTPVIGLCARRFTRKEIA